MPEITDQELDAAKKAIGLIQQLTANPDARAHFERSLKVIDPKVKTAEDQAAELAKPYVDQIAALQKRLDERDEAEAAARAERDEAEALAKLETGFDLLRKEGVTDEGMEKVKALMKEKTIPDPMAAFALYERMNPPPPDMEASYKPQGWDFEGDLMPDAKAWFTDTDRAEEQAIGQVLLEERKRSGSV